MIDRSMDLSPARPDPSNRCAAMLLLVALLLLGACARTPIRRNADTGMLAQQAARETLLLASPDWSLSGRIAVSDGHDGGSGRIDWIQHGLDFDIRLSAPITRQSWRLSKQGSLVRLEGLDGGPREGTDAQTLLQQAVGWVVPVDALSSWVRGARGPSPAVLQFDAVGLPSLLDQGGWAVDYRAWTTDVQPPLPKKIFAAQGASHVRLQVDRWGGASGVPDLPLDADAANRVPVGN